MGLTTTPRSPRSLPTWRALARTALVVLVGVVAMAVVGCKGTARITADVVQVGETATVSLDFTPASAGTAHFTGQPAFEGVGPIAVSLGGTTKVDVPLAAVPIGKHTITVTFEGKGRGLAKSVTGTTTFTFDRVAATPGLKLLPVAKAGARQLECKGELCDGTKLPVTADAKLSVELGSCDGCTVELTGQKVAVKGEHTSAVFDLTNAIGGEPVSELGITDMFIPFKVAGTDGATTEMKAGLLGSTLGAIVFRRVAQGPVKFDGEPAAGAPHSAVIVRREVDYGVERVVGPAALVREIDLVGLATATQRSLGSCGTYEKSDDKTRVNVAHLGLTYDVTMYDRRTAKTLGRRSFPPDDTGCGDRLVVGATDVTSFPSNDALDAWAKTFFR